jgi:hypothetical protein
MADYGFLVSLPGKDVLRPSIGDLVVATRYPLAKLDTTNQNSFKTLNIFFTTNPPDNATTLIYSYPHSYKYGKTPQVWALAQVTNGTSVASYQPYFYNSGILGINTPADAAILRVTADSTYIYIFVDKTSSGSPVNLISVSVKLRVYVFVDDIGY